jgi:short-subunit dehydrogenase
VGRNNEQVSRKVAELKGIYKNIRIESFVSDFSVESDLKELEAQFRMFADLDIGIVVNNAGSIAAHPYF